MDVGESEHAPDTVLIPERENVKTPLRVRAVEKLVEGEAIPEFDAEAEFVDK